MSREPSRRGSSRCWVSVMVDSLIARRSLSTLKMRSNDGIFFSISDHSSTRRAPSSSSDSGLMETRKSCCSGRTSVSKLKEPCVQVKRKYTASSIWTRMYRSSSGWVMVPIETSSSPSFLSRCLLCFAIAASSCSCVIFVFLTRMSPSRSRRLTIEA